MKILQINALNRTGSTGRICFELEHHINGMEGWQCFTAYSEGEARPGNYRIGGRYGKMLHALFSRMTGMVAHFSRWSTKALLRQIDIIEPDIVHLHNLHSNYVHFPMLMRYLATNRIPVALTLHDSWFYTGKCGYYVDVDCDRWRKGCGSCPHLKRYIPSWIFDRTGRMLREKRQLFADIYRLGVVGVSDWVAGEAKQSLLGEAAILHRIHNWVDTERFRPAGADAVAGLRSKLGIEDRFAILCVASIWIEEKGLGEVLRLAPRLDPGTCVVLVGDLPVSARALPENVISAGSTDSEDELAVYYSMADVFLTLSRMETFGLVSAEALAGGTPVICYDVTACPEVVEEGCGFTVPVDGDGEAVLQSIRRTKAIGKKHFSEKCRASALRKFQMQARMDDYMLFYKVLATGKA
ncbi:MAG: glycosyltransferase [Clostridiales Family XIII bacterium]|jgi:glycosyltransferase involved in cell wall biosynthesis|nr:glycosyltransferase [Clostridiales Family XIII bacterium]